MIRRKSVLKEKWRDQTIIECSALPMKKLYRFPDKFENILDYDFNNQKTYTTVSDAIVARKFVQKV